jgi:hypothetical protein
MPINVVTPQYGFNLPWFMLNLQNRQLITGPTIPDSIRDTKEILLTETPIPGLNYSPIQPNGNGNREIEFMIPLIKRNGNIGNTAVLNQFKALRNQTGTLRNMSPGQFSKNPKVLYYWGTGSVPLECFVKEVAILSKGNFVNQIANPEYSEISIKLLVDENSRLNRAEQMWRQVSSTVASVGNILGGVLQTGRGY